MDKIKAIENEQLRKDELTLNVGDTVKVYKGGVYHEKVFWKTRME